MRFKEWNPQKREDSDFRDFRSEGRVSAIQSFIYILIYINIPVNMNIYTNPIYIINNISIYIYKYIPVKLKCSH